MSQSENTRFHPKAAEKLKKEIEASGGIEVFAIADLNEKGLVVDLEVHCRGNSQSVPALLSRPKPGQAVIHNHPSGRLEASRADMILANMYGEDGIAVIIVNNSVDRALWVVEAHRAESSPVKAEDIKLFFEEKLPKAMPDYEAREGQISMASQVAEALNTGQVALLEAGTGTGKSLAYLAPAAIWASQNDSKVIVSTHTINLQGQLQNDDIPMLKACGIKIEHAILKGRNNYICKRRLAQFKKREPKDPTVIAIDDYAKTTKDGSKTDISFPIDADIWEDIGSDSDQTLASSCPEYDSCFYYNARKAAAKAQILIVNHHLLLTDLKLRSETGAGILPKADRIVIDEAHHLELVATAMLTQKVTSKSLRRAISPLLKKRKKPGALQRLANSFGIKNGPFTESDRLLFLDEIDMLRQRSTALWADVEGWMHQLADEFLTVEKPVFRILPTFTTDPKWTETLLPLLKVMGKTLRLAAENADRIQQLLQGLPEEAAATSPQPILDLKRVRRRLDAHGSFFSNFMRLSDMQSDEQPWTLWIDTANGIHKEPTGRLCMAPIEAGASLRRDLFKANAAVVATSATLTVDKSFAHLRSRIGLVDPIPAKNINEAQFQSPFNYKRQALLAIPTDLPIPNHPDHARLIAPFIVESIKRSPGGVFILCTSFKLIAALHSELHRRLAGERRLFRQGEMGRMALLERFIQSGDGVLLGADSFWEGVSVKGKALSMVILPRLPFRAPNEPITEARTERLKRQGKNPFVEYALPQAALRLRQGVGRLIRTTRDRGVVLILDGRIKSKWYGQSFLNSLPPMRQLSTSQEETLQELSHFFQA